jgi:hypothetical protein
MILLLPLAGLVVLAAYLVVLLIAGEVTNAIGPRLGGGLMGAFLVSVGGLLAARLLTKGWAAEGTTGAKVLTVVSIVLLIAFGSLFLAFAAGAWQSSPTPSGF